MKTDGAEKTNLTIGIDASRAFVSEPAGPEYYSRNLIQSIAKIDKRHQYILYTRLGQKPNFPLPRNFRIKEIPLRYLWTQLGLATETLLHPPDVLFIPAHTLPLLTKILLPRVPILVTIHGLEGKFLPQAGNFLSHVYRNWSITWAVKLATSLIAVSENTRTDIIQTYHISSQKITLIHEGVDARKFGQINAKRFQEVAEKYRLPKKYILFVGTIQPRKNLVRLIKAVAGLKGVNLVIAGKLGWNYAQVVRLAKQYGAVLTGRVDGDDLPCVYKGAELFVLPSVTEGFGLPVLEAQIAGVPVVVSNAGALPEVAGEGALLVDPLSMESIRNGIKQVLTNTVLRDQLIKKGRENVEKFSWTKTADSTIKQLVKMAGMKEKFGNFTGSIVE